MNWIRRLFHRHDWVTWRRDVLGEFEKQEGQDNVLSCLGECQVCSHPSCGDERFVPNDRRLRPVRGFRIIR